MNKPTALAISPDGRDLFVTGYCCADGFGAFRRDVRTGALVRTLCCDADPRAVARGYDVAVSPDGRNVYIASALGGGHGLAILERDPKTGRLTQLDGPAGCIQRIGANGCATPPTDSFAPARVVVSGDGTSVYVISNGDLFSFVRNTETGSLTAGPCYQARPQPPCTGLPLSVIAFVTDIVVSPDGRNIYLLGQYRTVDSLADVLVALQRRDADSTLLPLRLPYGCLTPPGGSDDCVPTQGLSGQDFDEPGWGAPHQLVTSADGRAVYLARTYGDGGSGGAGVVTFFRDAETGTLRPSTGHLKIRVLSAVIAATVLPSADGNSLYATEEGYPDGIDAIKLFRSHP